MEQARIEHAPNGSLLTNITIAMVNTVSFKKSLESSHGVLQLLKKYLYSFFIIAFAEATLFTVSWASSSEYCFVLVNDLYIGDPLEANKRQEICIFQLDSAHEHTE